MNFAVINGLHLVPEIMKAETYHLVIKDLRGWQERSRGEGICSK